MARWVSQTAVCSGSKSALGRVRFLAEVVPEVDSLIRAYFQARPRGETVTPHVLTELGEARVQQLADVHGRSFNSVKQDIGRLVPVRMNELYGDDRVLTYREGRGSRSPSTRPVPPEFGSWINKFTPHRLVGTDNSDRIILDANVVRELVHGDQHALDLDWLWLVKGDHPVSIADPAWAEVLHYLLRYPNRLAAWPEIAAKLTAVLDPSLPVVPSGWEAVALAGIKRPHGYDPAAAAAYYNAVWTFTAGVASLRDLERTIRFHMPGRGNVEIGPFDPETLHQQFHDRLQAWWAFIERVKSAAPQPKDELVRTIELDLLGQGIDPDGVDRLGLYLRAKAGLVEGVNTGAKSAKDNDGIDFDILMTTALPAWLCTSDQRLINLARESGHGAADSVLSPQELLAELDLEIVASAVSNLAAFPDLRQAVMPGFETNARGAVERIGYRQLHDDKRISLLTLLNDLTWSNQGMIVQTINDQLVEIDQVVGLESLHRKLGECERGSLLSTASEMALVCFLLSRGASVELERRITVEEKQDDGDVDILATWPWGAVALEVYSPVHQMTNTRSGWISLRPDGLAPRVSKKARATYGESGSSVQGLPEGTLKVVAVDVTYNDRAYAGLHLPLGKVPDELVDVDLAGADAVLVFTHYQHQPGHPVVVHGILKSATASTDLLWQTLQVPHESAAEAHSRTGAGTPPVAHRGDE